MKCRHEQFQAHVHVNRNVEGYGVTYNAEVEIRCAQCDLVFHAPDFAETKHLFQIAPGPVPKGLQPAGRDEGVSRPPALPGSVQLESAPLPIPYLPKD